MSSEIFYSPDLAEPTGSVDKDYSLRENGFPLTLAAGQIPQPGVSYTPRLIVASVEGSYTNCADEDGLEVPNATSELITVLPAPTPPTPEKLIRS